MADPAKLEINSLIESIRKHLDPRTPAGRLLRRPQDRNRRQNSQATAALEIIESLELQLASYSHRLEQRELEIVAAEVRLEQQLESAKQTPGTVPQYDQFNLESMNQRSKEEFQSQFQSQFGEQIRELLASQLSGFVADFSSKFAERMPAFFQGALNRQTESEQTNELETRYEQLHKELLGARARLLSTEEQLLLTTAEAETTLAELSNELLAARQNSAILEAELARAKEAIWDAKRDIPQPTSTDESIISDMAAEIDSLQSALATVRAELWHSASSTSIAEQQKLCEEIADLRQQNSDLASQLAQLQMPAYHNAPHLNLSQESMTWEQRKRLILQQLENESAAEDQIEQAHRRIEIQDVLRTTQSEIDRRDREIQELKSIVEQQSNTREGVAIGAAAIAQMLDSDELVRLEREKLVAIQHEWEAKLREAEIQISMERAKLSRERVSLEEQLHQRSSIDNIAAVTAKVEVDAKPVRRWLQQLGL